VLSFQLDRRGLGGPRAMCEVSRLNGCGKSPDRTGKQYLRGSFMPRNFTGDPGCGAPAVAFGKGAQQIPRLPPDFLSCFVASANSRAAFLKESRIRGRWLVQRVGNPESARDDKGEGGASMGIWLVADTGAGRRKLLVDIAKALVGFARLFRPRCPDPRHGRAGGMTKEREALPWGFS
jgi:hypothetical protein